ncbi:MULTISPECIES: TetR/AcrR family transcriptional regulator [unclassified Streptomyces]|uniref:TetR/AcrR family transcriptional regulator n=1 Tax=unclassified Streptomyces TaxID=2593676 RepID=UPI002250C4D2|nr:MULTISPECIES: TetR/AcrR family transcriptional regulator [unclassified Streptomyces]MCX4524603.1 TetR/AcrR family transcriptional regulator [Streptomyces sp. NBC_01551]MCX4544873.1 TetR/AcrR family transcriptional regulator [Streptomyces sp. NBC_01565]
MAKDRSGAGDPVRTLELLWREPGQEPRGGRRGPRQGLTVDAVVRAAIGLADEEGLAALTMRALAQRLGVTPMTVYTYVPGKAELLDLMLDEAYRTMERQAEAEAEPGEPGAGEAWRAKVTRVAEENRALLVRHPWIADLAVTRPPLGPGVIGKYEHELAAFDGIGLTDTEMDAALTHLLGFVHAGALAAADTAAHNARQSDEDWWAVSAPLLERAMDPERYPLAGRVGSSVGAYSPDTVWAFGLRCVLDGLARLVEEAQR